MRRILLTAVLLLGVNSVEAAPADLPGALGKCAAIGDAQARLACYDDLARSVNPPAPSMSIAAPAAPIAPVVAAPAAKPSNFGENGIAPQTSPDQFGSERLPPPPAQDTQAPKEIDSITATLTEYAKNPFGKFIVFLDNGQVWRQLQGDSGEARFNRNPKDNKVTISRALFGSYSMLLNGSAKTYKVERIK
jgi:hypothetical protein